MYSIRLNEDAIVVKSSGVLTLDERKLIVGDLMTALDNEVARPVLIDHRDATISGTVQDAMSLSDYIADSKLLDRVDGVYALVKDNTQSQKMVDITAMASLGLGKPINVCLELAEVMKKSGVTSWPLPNDS